MKLTEQLKGVIESYDKDSVRFGSSGLAIECETICKEGMAGFAEWAAKNGWTYNKSIKYWGDGGVKFATTDVLVRNYLKETE